MSKNSQKTVLRRLTLSLYLSGALNIFLVTAFMYQMFQENPPSLFCDLKPVESKVQLAVHPTNKDVITHYKTLSRDLLIRKLLSKELLEDGLTERDLALGCLVTFHHFHLFKALSEPSPYIQTRILTFGVHQDKVLTYPGLSDKQFDKLFHFATTEKWPLTARGLFLLLKEQKTERDKSLADAFYLTNEFLTMETLFGRAEKTIEKNEILDFLLDGDWKTLAEFSAKQKKEQDLSDEARRFVLLDYAKSGCQKAARLLLKLDFEYVAKKLDDNRLIALLNLLKEKTDDSLKLAKILMSSPRHNAVRDVAAAYLTAACEATPLMTSKPRLSQVVSMPAKATSTILPKPLPLKIKTYTVQEGDSLWKISRKFKIDIELLKSSNKLTSDCLQPGTQLKIP